MEKRLFFAVEIHAPWTSFSTQGRILAEKNRHLTLAFLGHVEKEPVVENFPKPSFKVGFVGQFDHLLFLPKKEPRVVSYHLDWLTDPTALIDFQKTLLDWLKLDEKRDFLPHVTVARHPQNLKQWQEEFTPLPFLTSHIHLFESHPGSQYTSVWHYPIAPPFEEIEHTADIAYLIQATCLKNLFDHAKTALCFSFPSLLSFLTPARSYASIPDIVKHLNEIISKADGEIGCPFKAVSYSGKLQTHQDLLQWEMIIDV